MEFVGEDKQHWNWKHLRKFVRLPYDRNFNWQLYFSHERLLKLLSLHYLSERGQARDFSFLHKFLHGFINCPNLLFRLLYLTGLLAIIVYSVAQSRKSIRPLARIQYEFNTSAVINKLEADIVLREQFYNSISAKTFQVNNFLLSFLFSQNCYVERRCVNLSPFNFRVFTVYIRL